MLLTPLPVTKYDIIKSSKLIVNAIRAPDIIPGIICGTITLVRACQGVAPRSMHASARFGSKLLSLGDTLSITYGMQNITCAASIVPSPFLTPNALKNIRSPIAVTISGFIIGRSFTLSTIALTTLLLFESPIAVIVPTNVEITVASTATSIVYPTASIISPLLNIFSYQRSENPFQWVRLLLLLKENIIVYIIGA